MQNVLLGMMIAFGMMLGLVFAPSEFYLHRAQNDNVIQLGGYVIQFGDNLDANLTK